MVFYDMTMEVIIVFGMVVLGYMLVQDAVADLTRMFEHREAKEPHNVAKLIIASRRKARLAYQRISQRVTAAQAVTASQRLTAIHN